jgi:DegV family protein with EDD domain
MNQSVRIITDSIADIPAPVAQRLGIAILPIYLRIGTQSYRDDGSLDRGDFYAQLWQTPERFGTAAPPPAEFLAAYEALVAEGAREIIGLFLSSNLSSIVNNARMAGQQLTGARVHILETGQVSMGMGWQAIAAAEAAAREESTAQIIQTVENVRPRTLVAGALNSLDHLRRGGRVSWAQAWVGELLQIKPLVSFKEGNAVLFGKVRTHHRALQALVDWIGQQAPLERLALLHSHVEPDLISEFRAMLAPYLPPGEIPVVEVTPVFGVHVGPGAVGVAFVQSSPASHP